ncbi:uncharacterized protein LOC111080708 [Drosophila obscura]|uniref:uncharacterized protein LOC111080708 n=1 Tax=Drosophila obscura TaxID=7282 RepID=UPI001BB1B994|nr:uncharacterized protein LOC111080708 [Drosophila obscura]XP_022232184.2 uncharacterized protein LOC111080708 [Drosophila obscura]
MRFPWLVLASWLSGAVAGRGAAQRDAPYDVVGVSCGQDEVVSCMLVQCTAGSFCPAEQFCYDPKCVCRRGYRRVRGACLPKHTTRHLDSDTLSSALLQTHF